MIPSCSIPNRFTDVAGLRSSGIFPQGKEPSVASLRAWAKARHIPYHKVGHFVYFDPAEVEAHIRSKLRVAANELNGTVVARQQSSSSPSSSGAFGLRRSVAMQRPLRVIPFRNRNGVVTHRVTGWLKGVRIRRNFRTLAEAETERERLELQRLDHRNQLRTAITRLTDDQLREAEAAFQIIDQQSRHSLLFFVNHALAHHARAGYQVLLSDAATRYLAAKAEERDRKIISDVQLVNVTRAMKRLRAHFPEQPVSEFTGERLLPFLEAREPSRKTYNNRRSLAFNFFKYATRHDWIAENPVEKTPYYRVAHRRASPLTLSAHHAAELMWFLESFNGGALVPYFALCLFAGIRPCFRQGEMSRLPTEAVILDTRSIHVEPWVAKMKMKRTVTIQPNLAAWLCAYPFDRFPILPKNVNDSHRQIFARFDLQQEILRHTFISMFVGKFRSVGEAALQAGNSEAVIRRFYLDVKSQAEAEGFFAILPRRRGATLLDGCPN